MPDSALDFTCMTKKIVADVGTWAKGASKQKPRVYAKKHPKTGADILARMI